jgi:hypothetical protein
VTVSSSFTALKISLCFTNCYFLLFLGKFHWFTVHILTRYVGNVWLSVSMFYSHSRIINISPEIIRQKYQCKCFNVMIQRVFRSSYLERWRDIFRPLFLPPRKLNFLAFHFSSNVMKTMLMV